MENFIITFGQGHTHRVNNITFNKDCVAVIKAKNHTAAREIAFEFFGDKFGTSYDEKSFNDGKLIQWFPDGKKEAN